MYVPVDHRVGEYDSVEGIVHGRPRAWQRVPREQREAVTMARKSKREKIEKHKQSLGDVIEDPESYGVRTKPRSKQRRRDDEGSEEDERLPAELTNKIMREAHLQQEEIKKDSAGGQRAAYKESLAGAIQNLQGDAPEDSDDGWSDPEMDDHLEAEWDEEVDAEDEAVLAAFMSKGDGSKQRTLADIIMEKIKEKEAGGGGDSGVRYDPVLRSRILQPLCTVPLNMVDEYRSGGLRHGRAVCRYQTAGRRLVYSSSYRLSAIFRFSCPIFV